MGIKQGGAGQWRAEMFRAHPRIHYEDIYLAVQSDVKYNLRLSVMLKM
jgi:hypothetical protein